MSTSLLPERPLVISPTLAATIGLEEAVMLQTLADFIGFRPEAARSATQGKRWVRCSLGEIAALFPFWAPIDVRRNQRSLQTLGLISIDAVTGTEDEFFIAIEEAGSQPAPAVKREKVSANKAPPRPQKATASSGATLIPPNWQPDSTWVSQCKQHNIPDEFILRLVPEFIAYWRDRGQARFSWGNAFFKHVLKEWRNEQTRTSKYELSTEMSESWRPSQDAIEILENSGVSGSFLEDAIPEFVLYWRERGLVHGAWNTKFIEHIRRQWAKYSASFGHDSTPRIIPDDWQPSADCFEILALAEIDERYAADKVAEFVLYWKDSQQVKSSWNTVFLQYIKHDWARRLKSTNPTEESYGEDQSFIGSSQQRVKDRFEQIKDRSWAE